MLPKTQERYGAIRDMDKHMQSNNMRSEWFEVNDWHMYTRVALDQARPDAPTVVLVHGLGLSSRYLRPTTAHFAPHYQVYAPDLPGFGKSTKPQQFFSVEELTDALVAWMDVARIDRPVLLGNSLGCQVIVDLAVRYPHRVAAAVLQGPTVDPHARSWSQQMIRLLHDGLYEPPSHSINLIVDYPKCGVRRFLATFRNSLYDRIEEKLPQVQAPTLVVRGTNDPIVPQQWAEEACHLLTNGHLAVVPGASHTMVYAFPLELLRVVRPFIEQHVPRSDECVQI